MDISIVISCFNKKVFPNELEKNIRNLVPNSEIVYLTNKENQINTEENVLYFNEANEDKALNSAIKLLSGKKILLIRENYNLKEFDKIEAMLLNKSTADIVLYSKQRKKFNKFLFKIVNKINLLLFGYNLFDGDLSLMLFNDNPTTVLKVLDNSSVFMKINKWIGMSVCYLENIDFKCYKPKEKFTKEIVMTSSFAFLFVLSIVLWASISAFHTLLFGMIFFLLTLLSLSLALITAVRLFNFYEVGRVINEKTEILNLKENENE